MRKIAFAALALIILAITSCSKKDTPKDIPVSPGSWTLHGISHTATFCVFDQGSLIAGDENSDTISITFYNYVLPITSGQYTVVLNPTAANQVAIVANVGVTPYVAFSGGTAGITVTGGKVSVTGTNISLMNPTPPASDTTSTTFSLKQQ